MLFRANLRHRRIFGSGTRPAPALLGVWRALKTVRSPVKVVDNIAAILKEVATDTAERRREVGRRQIHLQIRLHPRAFQDPLTVIRKVRCQPRRFKCRRSWQASLSISSSRLSTYCLRCFSFSVRPALAHMLSQPSDTSFNNIMRGRTRWLRCACSLTRVGRHLRVLRSELGSTSGRRQHVHVCIQS